MEDFNIDDKMSLEEYIINDDYQLDFMNMPINNENEQITLLSDHTYFKISSQAPIEVGANVTVMQNNKNPLQIVIENTFEISTKNSCILTPKAMSTESDEEIIVDESEKKFNDSEIIQRFRYVKDSYFSLENCDFKGASKYIKNSRTVKI